MSSYSEDRVFWVVIFEIIKQTKVKKSKYLIEKDLNIKKKIKKCV